MNITLPPETTTTKDTDQSSVPLHPIMVYIHGGSLLFGGANRPVYDHVNFVSHAVETGSPVVGITFNYRVGIGGFLASKAIRDELAAEGHAGVGNFGFTDQQVALEWVQRYVLQLGGDTGNVTLYGESAGGMSVDHQLHAAKPPIFHRAILMSGLINTIPTWSLEHHERFYRALCRYLGIDPDADAANALDQLRELRDSVVADATTAVAGIVGTTGNGCDDGWFHGKAPQFNDLTSEPQPRWLRSLMVGDVYHEGMIFTYTIRDDDYASLRRELENILSEKETDTILRLYGLSPDSTAETVQRTFEEMAGDALFRVQNYLTAHRSGVKQTYGYHFDQRSTLDHPVRNLAYHAHDLLYVFLNIEEKMTDVQWAMAKEMATAWVDFAYGRDPWERFEVGHRWMCFGDDSRTALKSESADEPMRRYGRMQRMLDMGVYEAFVVAVDAFATKRSLLGTFK